MNPEALTVSRPSPTESPARTGELRLALPKGRMETGVLDLLAGAGIEVTPTARSYRPAISLEGVDTKIFKPQNVVEMLGVGRRDLGFAGADWVAELDIQAVELLDTELDPVTVVAAAPPRTPLDGRRLIVASEYERLTREWIDSRGLDADFAHTYGATEVFPPEDADVIVDNTATGSTLRANGLEVVDTLMRSSTRLYACPRALEDFGKKRRIEDLVLVLQSVLEARQRVMLEINVASANLERVVELLPSMRQATVSTLYGDQGFGVKAAIPRSLLPTLIPEIKAAGGSDVVVTELAQLVP